ncbi:hypothetical protein COL922a_012763 [Colletotrichum nupharicola]|nr:hypothetical protein COL922a_012763 [Colletotrichum nupharicola]
MAVSEDRDYRSAVNEAPKEKPTMCVAQSVTPEVNQYEMRTRERSMKAAGERKHAKGRSLHAVNE